LRRCRPRSTRRPARRPASSCSSPSSRERSRTEACVRQGDDEENFGPERPAPAAILPQVAAWPRRLLFAIRRGRRCRAADGRGAGLVMPVNPGSFPQGHRGTPLCALSIRTWCSTASRGCDPPCRGGTVRACPRS
jgi:hypothetical protein